MFDLEEVSEISLEHIEENAHGLAESRFVTCFKRGAEHCEFIPEPRDVVTSKAFEQFLVYLQSAPNDKSHPYYCFFDSNYEDDLYFVGPRFNARILWDHFVAIYNIDCDEVLRQQLQEREEEQKQQQKQQQKKRHRRLKRAGGVHSDSELDELVEEKEGDHQKSPIINRRPGKRIAMTPEEASQKASTPEEASQKASTSVAVSTAAAGIGLHDSDDELAVLNVGLKLVTVDDHSMLWSRNGDYNAFFFSEVGIDPEYYHCAVNHIKAVRGSGCIYHAVVYLMVR